MEKNTSKMTLARDKPVSVGTDSFRIFVHLVDLHVRLHSPGADPRITLKRLSCAARAGPCEDPNKKQIACCRVVRRIFAHRAPDRVKEHLNIRFNHVSG